MPECARRRPSRNSARNSRQRGNQADITADPEFPAELRKHFVING
jgi:hypothetical protein